MAQENQQPFPDNRKSRNEQLLCQKGEASRWNLNIARLVSTLKIVALSPEVTFFANTVAY
jgi:hypothetical protein